MGLALPAVATALGASASTAATLGTIGSVASAIGTGVSVIGAIKSGKAEAASAKYNAAVQANNATTAKQNAERAAQAGEAKVAMQQRETRAKVGAIQANQAAAGIDISSDSATNVRSSAAELGQLDALTIRANAAREAYGYQTEGANFEAQSNLSKMEAKSAKTSGLIKAGTLLGTALGSSDAWGDRTTSAALDDGSSFDSGIDYDEFQLPEYRI